MKFLLHCLLLLCFPVIASAQCPVIDAAMVNACGTNEGINEFVLFTTTSPALAGNYTFYYGNNPVPAAGLPVSILSGANATLPTGTGSVTSTNGCTINQVTSPVTVIPAGSKVLFIPANFDANYDVSSICSASNLYVAYIDITALPSSWNVSDVMDNMPLLTSYLQVRNSATACAGAIVSYANGWAANNDGNIVWWGSTGTPDYGNYGCSQVTPPVTISNITAATVCGGGSSTTASFTTTGTPDQYSISWDAAATAAGFADITSMPLPASPLMIAIPVAAAPATYNATLTVVNTVTGFSSVAENIQVTVTAPSIVPLFTPIAAICNSAAAPLLPAVSTNGIPGTWSPAVISNTSSATYTFTPTLGYCATTTSLAVTVLSLPSATISGTATICSGTATNIIFNGTANATVTYTINGGANQTILLNGAGTATVSTGNLSANSTYALVSVATATCSGLQSGTVVVTVLPALTASISAAAAAVCSGTGTAINFNGTPNATVTYKVNSGANQTVVLNASGAASVATGNLLSGSVYTLVSVSSTGPPACSQPLTGSVSVAVNALPTTSISGSTTICEGSSTNINFNGTPNAIVTYSINGGANQTVSLNATGNAIVNSGALVSPATYTLVSAANTGANTCTQPVAGNAVIAVNPTPSATINGTATICSGTGSNFSFSGTPNATVVYTVNGGANKTIVLNAAGTAILPSGNLTATTSYQLISVSSATTPVCTAPLAGSAVLTIKALPVATISGSDTICSGTGSTINFNGTANATVVYKVNGGINKTIVLDATGAATLASGNLTVTTTYQLVSVSSATLPVCTAPLTGSAVITVNALPAATISGTKSICNGLSTNINFNGTPATTILYTTDGGLTNQATQLDATGSVAVNTGNLTLSQTFNLISISYTSGPACLQNISGSAVVTVFPVTPPPVTVSPVSYCQNEIASALTAPGNNLLWYTAAAGGTGSAAAPVPVTNAAGSTDYYVSQTLNGCESERSALTVIVNPTPDAPIVSLGTLYRCGTGPTTLKASAPGMIKWYSDSALTHYLYTGIAYSTVVSATTDFYVTSTENNCASPITVATVTVFPLVVQTAGFSYSPSTVCQGSQKSLPVGVAGFTPGGVFSSATGLSLHAITGAVDPSLSVPGTYVVKYTLGAALCTPATSSTATITITKNPTPATAFSYASPVCSSATNPTPIPGTGFTTGGVYSAPAGVAINSATGAIDLANSVAGAYIITYTLAATACTNLSVSTASITINTPPSPSVTSGIKRCGSGTVTLDATATGTIKWYTDAALTKLVFTGTTYTTAVTASTNFYVTNTVAGCVSAVKAATATVVPVTAQVTAFNYNPSAVCAGSAKAVPVAAAGFVPGGIYSSVSGLSVDSITGIVDPAISTAGTYTVKYTLPASACALTSSSTTSITISTTLPTITSFSYPTPVCITSPNPSPTLAAGFTTGGTYSAGSGLAINKTTGAIDIAASIPASYTVTYSVAQTSCGAAGSSTADITISSASAAPVTTGAQRCGTGTVNLSATGNGTINWYADAALTKLLFTGTTYSVPVTATTDFYVTNTVGNCVSSAASARATVNPLTNQVTGFSYTPATVCAANTAPVPVPATGFATGGTYSSATGLIIESNTGIINIAASAPGTYAVKYTLPSSVCTVTNSSTTNITITDNAIPVTMFSYPALVCSNAGTVMPVPANSFALGGIFSSKSGLFINSTTGSIDPAKSIAGKYIVAYSIAATLCTPAGSSQADITIAAAPVPPVVAGDQRCGSGIVNLKATSAETVNWYNTQDLNTLLLSGPQFNPVVTGSTNFYVTAFNGNCASAAIPVAAAVFPMPATPSLGKNNSICQGDHLVISPGSYSSYLWQDNSTNSSFTVTEPGDYSVVVKTANGCTDSTGITVVISHNCDDILFPTAFSPNGDGLNDNFGPLPLRNLALLKNYTLRIYNRYGQVVFSSNNPYEKWDGSQKGQSADTGSYMWRAEYIYDTGNSLKKSGSVTIVH